MDLKAAPEPTASAPRNGVRRTILAKAHLASAPKSTIGERLPPVSESAAYRVYGDTVKLRRALRQKQGTAKDLLGRIEGVRATYAGVVFSAKGG